jgi:hypothetical protein
MIHGILFSLYGIAAIATIKFEPWWKAIGLRFVSGYYCKIEPDTQVTEKGT